MLMPSVLPFLQGGRALRRHRAQLQQALRVEPALRLLPNLITLPLGAAPLPDPEALLAEPSSLAIVAPPAGGRSLALLQVAARAAEGGRAPAVYLSLPDDDAPNLTPRAVVAAAAYRAGLPAALVDNGRPCLLLLDDFERLSTNRRATWRTYIAGLAQSWPAARALVALPPGEPWPELRELRLGAPDAAALRAWLTHLLPGQPPEPILAALAAEPLAALRGAPAELLLLALVYPIGGLPASRAALYEQAFALVGPLLEEAREEARKTPADGGPPAPSALGRAAPYIGRAALRNYRLARGLAGGDDLATLADLPAAELAAVAPLAAGLLDDPRPVLDLLWAAAADVAALRGLAVCLRERPAAAPADGLRLLDALAAPDAGPEAHALLHSLMPALPAMLAAAGLADAAAALARVAAAAPAGLDAALLATIDSPGADERLRWAAADRLAERGAAGVGLLDTPDGLDPTALAARCYVAAVAAPAERLRLSEPQARVGLLSLLGDAGGDGRRRAAVSALLDDPATPVDLRALALAAAPAAGAEDLALLERAAADSAPHVRRAALSSLAAGEPEAALDALEAALSRDGADPVAVRDALETVAGIDSMRAAALLGRSALSARLRLDARVYAIELLGGRGRAGAAVLLRLIDLPRLAAGPRAAAARHLGRMGVAAALPALRATLLADGPPLVRRAAAEALGDLARIPACRDGALAGMLAALEGPWLDMGLGVALARSLAACGPAALPALGDLISPSLADDLRSDWLALAPALATTPAAAWPELPLPPAARAALIDALAFGGTPADRPGGVDELVERQAATVATAAADSLVALVGRRPALRREAAVLLRRALRPGRPPELLAHIFDRLGDLVGAAPAVIGALLDSLADNPPLRWLALERLGGLPAAADALLLRLQDAQDDAFTRAKLIAMLGARAEPSAMPMLRHEAESRDADPHVRRAAVVALGQIGQPAAIATLLRLVADVYTPAEIRAAAAAALPGGLDPASCRLLRDQVRAERPPAELAAAVLAALGRAGDREALPLLIRYAQSDRPLEAVAAIEAIEAIGETSVAPPLVRVTHASPAPGVRLAAVCALLQLCGEEYLPLLRSYLDTPALPLRLRAHAALAGIAPADPRLLTPLADPAAPLALRLAALSQLAARASDDELLSMLLANPDEQPQLRLAVAAVLGGSGRLEAAAPLARAAAADGLPLLRRRCCAALAALAAGEGPAADAARGHLAELSGDACAELALWATEALLEAARP